MINFSFDFLSSFRTFFRHIYYVIIYTGGVNLGAISGNKYKLDIDKEYDDYIVTTICAKKSEGCEGEEDGVCAFTDDIYNQNIAQWNDKGVVGTKNDEGEGKEGYKLVFQNSSSQSAVSFTLFLHCYEGTNRAQGYYLMYEAHIYDVKACASSGMSGGWVFIIIVICSLAVYFLVGMAVAVKVQNKPVALSSLPGYQVFPTLISNALAGCNFLVSKITGKSSSASSAHNSYESYGTTNESL